MTAFGSHEWLNNENTGETASPIWVRLGVVRVCVFVENFRAYIVNLKAGLECLNDQPLK